MARREIEGLDELRATLDPASIAAALLRPMQRSVLRLQGHLADYSRVLGPAVPSYKRGQGQANRHGVVRRRTSQNLGKRWTSGIRHGMGPLELIGFVGNTVSYGPYVHGGNDTYPQQAWMHRNRGAKTDTQVLAEEEGWITNEFEVAVHNALNKRG